MTIRTNNQWREFVYRWDVPEEILNSQFDYQDPEETSDGFFCYHGVWYHLDQFMRIDSYAPEPMRSWHGYCSDSFFSGVLIRLSPDGATYQVGTYLS